MVRFWNFHHRMLEYSGRVAHQFFKLCDLGFQTFSSLPATPQAGCFFL